MYHNSPFSVVYIVDKARLGSSLHKKVNDSSSLSLKHVLNCHCKLYYVHPFNILSSLIIEKSTIWWKCYLKSGVDVSLKCLQNCYFIDVPSELSLFLSNGMFLHFMCVFHLNGVDHNYEKVFFTFEMCLCDSWQWW